MGDKIVKNCLMLVTQNFENKIANGADVINKRNYKLLQENFDNVDILYCRRHINTNKSKLYSKFKNVIDLSISDCKSEILTFLKTKVKNYNVIFIGQSSLGEFAEIIKKENSEVLIITFFHNVELDYYWTQCNLYRCYYLVYVLISWLNEKKAIRFSDKIITLNKRDSKRIYKLYGRSADLLLPTSFENKSLVFNENIINPNDLKLLFIGSNFYPNKQGIIWFIRNVLDKLDNTVLEIIGRGTSEWLNESIFKHKKIKIYGEVENLDYYYINADAVVIPIFIGGGMKTKTAEALMYGKHIFATQEAFEGYDIDYNKVGALCNTAEEFINKINLFSKSNYRKYNSYSREIFLKNYDEKINRKKFKNFIDERRTDK